MQGGACGETGEDLFLTLVCQVLLFLGERARARGRARARACAPSAPSPAAPLLLAPGLESWPDSRLALAEKS